MLGAEEAIFNTVTAQEALNPRRAAQLDAVRNLKASAKAEKMKQATFDRLAEPEECKRQL